MQEKSNVAKRRAKRERSKRRRERIMRHSEQEAAEQANTPQFKTCVPVHTNVCMFTHVGAPYYHGCVPRVHTCVCPVFTRVCAPCSHTHVPVHTYTCPLLLTHNYTIDH